MFEEIIQASLNAIMAGAIYAVIASSLSLVYGVTHLINLAHGAFLILFSYIAYVLFSVLGMNPIIVCVLVIILGFGISYLVQRIVVLKVIYLNPVHNLLTFWGIQIIIENFLLYIFGPVEKSISFVKVPTFDIRGITIPGNRFLIFLVSITLLSCLTIFLHKTLLGKAIRAVYQDPIGAKLQGINVEHIYNLTFAIGGTIAAISAILLLQLYAFSPTGGNMYLLYAFFAVVVGGLGYLPGTYAAAFLLGFLESFTAQFSNLRWLYLITFTLLYVTLVLRPKGLFGKGM